MRQQSPTQYVGIVKLKTESLLATAGSENGKLVIDEDQKRILLAEQAEFIEKIKSLSADVKIIATYKMVLNAIAFTAPNDLLSKIEAIEGVSRLEQSSSFLRPSTVGLETKVKSAITSLNEKNTVTFIGADKAHKLGIAGQKMRVGVIDTGIDYTHSMLGGPGKKKFMTPLILIPQMLFFLMQKLLVE
jgi:minor extracellular serine protease Vpr